MIVQCSVNPTNHNSKIEWTCTNWVWINRNIPEEKVVKAVSPKRNGIALKEIYEPHDWLYIINNENANGNFGNYNVYNTQADFAFETMKKYIEKREVENQQLKEENEQLKTR